MFVVGKYAMKLCMRTLRNDVFSTTLLIGRSSTVWWPVSYSSAGDDARNAEVFVRFRTSMKEAEEAQPVLLDQSRASGWVGLVISTISLHAACLLRAAELDARPFRCIEGT